MPSSPIRQACRNRSGPISPCSKSDEEDPVDTARQQPREVGLAHRERQLAEILAVADQAIEGVELDLGIVLARMQAVEIAAAVDTEQHGFAIEDEGAIPITERSLGYQRKPIAPVVAIAGP